MFDTIFHADWSGQESKQWRATAERNGLGWIVDAPKPAPALGAAPPRDIGRGC
jgi:hypothetical protein